MKMKVSSIDLVLAAISTKFDIGWAEETLILHTSGRRRQEAKLLERKVGEKNGIAYRDDAGNQHRLRLGSSWGECKPNIGDGCLTDSSCCGEMECLGVVNWACGNTPGTEGEYCNLVYACDEDLVCHEDVCTDYADLLKKGTKETCKEGSAPGTLKVMSYNLFLIRCLIPGDNPFPCQHEDERMKRIVPNLFNWMEQSDADVVMFQEVWSLTNEIIDGMAEAGFCHYLSNAFEKTGSGLQIFSKYPLENGDFLDYYDLTGANSESVLDPEILADKGIMYVKVEKNGQSYHIADTHTLSNTLRENHDRRMEQYETMRRFVEEKSPDANDMVLYGGDMNEDKYNHHVGDQYYKEMLEELEAFGPEVEGDQQYSYDTLKNPIPASFQEKDYEELLDYVLVSNKHEQLEQSSCEILIPQWPLDCDGKFECMISDHFPVLCTFVGPETTSVA